MDTQKAYQRMCRYAAVAERCSWDVERKLRLLGLSADQVCEIIERMKRELFIDDARYASAYARDKFRFNGWGPIRIQRELRLRHIDERIVEAALVELHTLDHAEDAVTDRLEELLIRKLASTKEIDPAKRYAQVVRWALSRGFRYEDIRCTLERLLVQLPEE